MDKPDQKSFRRVGEELRDLTEQHPALKHPIAQQHLQAWMDAQQNDDSPEVLCGKLAKTIVELVALFQAHAELTDEQIEAILRASMAMWEERNASGA